MWEVVLDMSMYPDTCGQEKVVPKRPMPPSMAGQRAPMMLNRTQILCETTDTCLESSPEFDNFEDWSPFVSTNPKCPVTDL
jgi:hypothetical protein